jgi:shikimate dehydrogenase
MSPSRRAGVLGRPIAHSRSPLLHRAAYRELGLRWDYTAIDCGVAELAEVLAARTDWAGFSCTMPLKHAALAAAVQVQPRAAVVGAANTLLPLPGRPGSWLADNTDVAGIVAALAEHGVVAPASVTVLGAGGTAQAVVVALAESGVTAATALVREPARAERLIEVGAKVGLAVRPVRLRADAPELGAELVVSTLPPGAADAVAEWPWSPGQAVFDVIYDPWPTALAGGALRAGATVISGALLLLHQAAAQVELMTGRPAPVAAMRAALEA